MNRSFSTKKLLLGSIVCTFFLSTGAHAANDPLNYLECHTTKDNGNVVPRVTVTKREGGVETGRPIQVRSDIDGVGHFAFFDVKWASRRGFDSARGMDTLTYTIIGESPAKNILELIIVNFTKEDGSYETSHKMYINGDQIEFENFECEATNAT